ncbi:DUF2190 family protein [Nevskia sp.]|uniref:DUF2190 family protein n=1 Tax=Nevskia sp. TaxID=1929292 RepID=UPI0025E55FC9|nr:DUF2190 family protein [Nevskia sp.]
MSKNHVQPGKVIAVTLAAAVVAGALIQVGTLVGVAIESGGIGDTISVAIDEVFAVPKAAGAIGQGVVVYFDTSEGNVTTTATDNVRAGVTTKAALSGATAVDVKLNAASSAT